MKQYFGKYRGKVTRNDDPLHLGRIQVSVPSVLGKGKESWAMPSVPFAGPKVGLFLIPPEKANVWVEFEGGDPDKPIWTGCFWGTGEAPEVPTAPDKKILKTGDTTLTIFDGSGPDSVTLEVAVPGRKEPLAVILDKEGITLKNGKASVKLTSASVSVNDGALEVV